MTEHKKEFFHRYQDRDLPDAKFIELFKQGLDVNTIYEGKSALFAAALAGRLELVDYLIANRASINHVNLKSGFVHSTPLQVALQIGHEEMILLLLAKGADVNAQDAFGNTAIHQAIERIKRVDNPFGKISLYPGDGKVAKDPYKIIAEILKRNPNVNALNASGLTPLYLACDLQDRQLVQVLLDRGADPNVHGKSFPLEIASWHGNRALVQQLFQQNAKLDSAKQDRSNLIVRVLSGAKSNKRELDLELLELLIRNGENPKEKCVLRAAIEAGFKEAVTLLLKHGADVKSKRDLFGEPLFWSAIETKNVDMLEFLLKQGALPNQKKEHGKGWTALHKAASIGDEAVVRCLLKHGADPTLKDKEGRIPADLVESLFHGKLAKILDPKI